MRENIIVCKIDNRDAVQFTGFGNFFQAFMKEFSDYNKMKLVYYDGVFDDKNLIEHQIIHKRTSFHNILKYRKTIKLICYNVKGMELIHTFEIEYRTRVTNELYSLQYEP